MSTGDRVAIYANDLLPLSQTFIRDQAKSLKHWDPILVGRQRLKDGLDLSGLRTEIVPAASGAIGRTLHYWLQHSELNLANKLRALNVRLVHAHFSTDATDIWPTVKALGLPMLVTLHGYDINIHRRWWETGKGGLRRCAYPLLLLRMAQDPTVRFIAVSEAIKRRAIEYGIPENRISVCYIGVDTERFKPSGLPINQRRKRILYVGRMTEKKAPLLLIRAFAEVKKRIADAELVMVGTGPLLESARRLAKELSLPTEFLGGLDNWGVLEQLHMAKVFCLPSLTASNGDAEGFGLVILEAQACGVPVVTSAHGGAQEGILPGETGIAFEQGSLHDLVCGLLKYLEDDDAATSASIQAARFARQAFDIRDCTRQLTMSYRSMTN